MERSTVALVAGLTALGVGLAAVSGMVLSAGDWGSLDGARLSAVPSRGVATGKGPQVPQYPPGSEVRLDAELCPGAPRELPRDPALQLWTASASGPWRHVRRVDGGASAGSCQAFRVVATREELWGDAQGVVRWALVAGDAIDGDPRGWRAAGLAVADGEALAVPGVVPVR